MFHDGAGYMQATITPVLLISRRNPGGELSVPADREKQVSGGGSIWLLDCDWPIRDSGVMSPFFSFSPSVPSRGCGFVGFGTR